MESGFSFFANPKYYLMKQFIIPLLFFCGCPIAHAAETGNPGIQAREFTEQAKSFPAVNLLDSTAVDIQDNGSGTFYIRRIVQINNAQGALENRVLVYDYDPFTATASFQNVTIYRTSGDTIQVDITKAQDYVAPARMIYWSARQIMIEIGALQPGDIIDYTIFKKGFTYALLAAPGTNASGITGSPNSGETDDESRFIPPMEGEFYDIIPFWSTTPTLRKVYRMAIPKHRDMQYKVYQGNCALSVLYEGEKKVYSFSEDCMFPPKREPNSLDYFDYAPKILVSSTNDWKAKSKWFCKVNEDYGSFNPIPKAEKKVKELLKGKKSEMEKISTLSHWVADNIRYSGIHMGKGEGYTLHNLKMNYTDRCGVCKDIASTLVSFLRIAGFKAYPAMTMAGSRIEKEIPADHFNHCVTVVQLSDSTWMPIDPTWIPFSRELWSSAEQQQNYLPGLPEGSDLCVTPISAPENHYLRMKAKTALAEDGTLTGEIQISAEGYTDLGLRRPFTQGWENQWFNAMEQQFKAVSPRARLIKADWGKNPRDYMAAPLSLSFRFEIPSYALATEGGNEFLVKPFLMSQLFARNRAESRLDITQEQREYGFQISCSQLLELDETMTLPTGYQLIDGAKENKTEDGGNVANSRGSLQATGNTLNFHQELSLDKRVFTAEDWEQVRTAVQNYRSFNSYLVFQKK